MWINQSAVSEQSGHSSAVSASILVGSGFDLQPQPIPMSLVAPGGSEVENRQPMPPPTESPAAHVRNRTSSQETIDLDGDARAPTPTTPLLQQPPLATPTPARPANRVSFTTSRPRGGGNQRRRRRCTPLPSALDAARSAVTEIERGRLEVERQATQNGASTSAALLQVATAMQTMAAAQQSQAASLAAAAAAQESQAASFSAAAASMETIAQAVIEALRLFQMQHHRD